MGLSIFYTGKLNSAASLPLLIEEVKEVAEVHNWKYDIFEIDYLKMNLGSAEFNDEAYGICFSPPKCEPICLTFLSNGVLALPWSLEYYIKKEKRAKDIPGGIFSKTQYAGARNHKIIILLLDYLSKKYFKEFELEDEGRYWETRDEKLLDETFKRYNELMDMVWNGLKTIEVKKGESIEAYFERMLKKISDNKKPE